MNTLEKLNVIERELARIRPHYEELRTALAARSLTSWVDGKGRIPRHPTAMEHGLVEHLKIRKAEIDKLEWARRYLFDKAVSELAEQQSEEGSEDPEILLRAALRAMANVWKSGVKTQELQVAILAIAAYLQSLDRDTT